MFRRVLKIAGLAVKTALIAAVGSVARIAQGKAESKIERRAQEILREAVEAYVKVVTP